MDHIDFETPPSRGWISVLEEVWMPLNWRETVTPDYIPYQLYDSAQAIFSSVAGMLAERETLVSLGVAREDASVQEALMLNVASEATSRIVSILFSWKYAGILDAECKKYRFMADIFNDASLVLQTFSSSIDTIAIRSGALILAGCLRALCGVCAGSSKAALTNHFARNERAVADINAKEGSQETLVYLVGLLLGSLIVPLVTSRTGIWTALLALVWMHLWANYRAVKSVCLNSINQQRLAILLLDPQRVLTPVQVSRREAILFPTHIIRYKTLHSQCAGTIIDHLIVANDSIAFASRATLEDKLRSLCELLVPTLDWQNFRLALLDAGWDLERDALAFDGIRYTTKTKEE